MVAVVALLWFLDQPAGTSKPAPQPNLPVRDEPKAEEKDRKSEKKVVKDEEKSTRPGVVESSPSLSFTYKDGNTSELFEFLEKNKNGHIELLLADNLDLEIKPKNESGMRELLVSAAEKITVKPAKEFVGRPAIRLTYSGGDAPKERAALRLRAKETTVEGIQFVIDAGQSDAALIGLALEGETHEVRNCDFVQKKPPLVKEKRLTSLLVSAGKTGNSAPRVELFENTFLGFKNDQPKKGSEVGGQDAIACRGDADAATVRPGLKPFGPHQSTFRLEGNKETLELDHCSVMAADQSAVFQLLPQARAHLKVRHSLFSRPGSSGNRQRSGRRRFRPARCRRQIQLRLRRHG